MAVVVGHHASPLRSLALRRQTRALFLRTRGLFGNAGNALAALQGRPHLGRLYAAGGPQHQQVRSEEHTSELQSLMRISYAVFCLKKKKHNNKLQKRT